MGENDLSIENILRLMKKEDKKHLKIKCFYLILISKFLMPTTQPKVNVHGVLYTQDIAKIKGFD